MNSILNDLHTDERISNNGPSSHDVRSEYRRDYDRIIFSAPFRRLQNKTQVFPLPGSVFVHNRLTHSLEVASVGRSMGQIIGNGIAKEYDNYLNDKSRDFYKAQLSDVISAGCLCHDIGNPAFGHSGEDAIAEFFRTNKSKLKKYFNDVPSEWDDLINFDGNANTLRIINRKRNNELGLTYSTVCSIIKYPCESKNIDKSDPIRKKLGVFQSEKCLISQIMSKTSIPKIDGDENTAYNRHPFVWLVEAADDICYNIIDLEDAHRLKIVEHKKCCEMLESIISEIDSEALDKRMISHSENSDISYLRAKAINCLINKCSEIFFSNMNDILTFKHKTPLFETLKKHNKSLYEVASFSKDIIYRNVRVIEIELAGFHVMDVLLNHFVFSVLEESPSKYHKKVMQLLPGVFNDEDSKYEKIMKVLDYISGMTDNFATDLYKRIKGIEIGLKF